MFDPATLATIAAVTGVSAKEFVAKVTGYRNRHRQISEERYQREREARVGAIFGNNLDVKLLRKYYERKMEGDDSYFYTYNVDGTLLNTHALTKPDWNTRQTELNFNDGSCSFTDKAVTVKLPDIENVARLTSVIERKKLTLDNRHIYSMTDFQYDQNCYQNEFSLIRFHKYKFTMGLIIDELYEAILDAEHDLELILQNPSHHLAVREMLLPSRQVLISPKNRVCAGGVFVVFVMAREETKDYAVITQIRSPAVADNQKAISVIPRAFHQHMIDPEAEINVLWTVLRETYEELFGGEEVEGTSPRVRPDFYVDKCPAIKWLCENLHNITVELVSYAFNGLSGNYEYGILFAIHDPYFWKQFSCEMVVNWEAKAKKLCSTSDTNKISLLLRDGDWATETLPPMIEGLMRLKELQPSKVALPELNAVKPS